MAGWITDLYNQCYLAGYGNHKLYHATDDSISSSVYTTFNQVVKDASQRICDGITASYEVGSTTQRPAITLSESEKFECMCAVGIKILHASHEDQDLDQVGDGV